MMPTSCRVAEVVSCLPIDLVPACTWAEADGPSHSFRQLALEKHDVDKPLMLPALLPACL
jgi:hypothetical protein